MSSGVNNSRYEHEEEDEDNNNNADNTKHNLNKGAKNDGDDRGNKWITIENKWSSYWESNNINCSDPDYTKSKFFITVAYPYPNSPQHIGHG
ncbi:MAG: hypothetical protein M3162_06920, partial [Thermoproteota archaeon]|nr:hypothetical protein [Thermoproteota archaeon]